MNFKRSAILLCFSVSFSNYCRATILDDLRSLYREVHQAHQERLGAAIGSGIGAGISWAVFAPTVLLAPVALDATIVTHIESTARKQNAIAQDKIYEAKHFLKEIETAYQIHLENLDKTDSEDERTINKYLSKKALRVLSEISTLDNNIEDLLSFIHEENESGMDGLMEKNPLREETISYPTYCENMAESCSRDYFISPDYLQLIKEYLVEKLKWQSSLLNNHSARAFLFMSKSVQRKWR